MVNVKGYSWCYLNSQLKYENIQPKGNYQSHKLAIFGTQVGIPKISWVSFSAIWPQMLQPIEKLETCLAIAIADGSMIAAAGHPNRHIRGGTLHSQIARQRELAFIEEDPKLARALQISI